eukprot:1158311-Pelagomonas_calceolata.AAC.8
MNDRSSLRGAHSAMHGCINKAWSDLQEGPVLTPGTANQCQLCVSKDWLLQFFQRRLLPSIVLKTKISTRGAEVVNF